MDTNTAMETAKESAKVLTKLQEIIEKCFNPHWTKKQNDVDIEADEKRIKLIRDNQDMEITYVNGQMSARQRTPEELAQRAEQRMLAESIRQEKNLENVIEIASADLLSGNEVVDENVDDDWITRLFNIAKDVSSTEMQYVWGKILAGEIKRPGSFSLRTLDTIRNLSQNEAVIFQKITPYIIRCDDGAFIVSSDKLLKKYDILYNDIMVLDECGLMNSNSTLTLNFDLSDTEEIFLFNNNKLAKITGLSNETTQISFGLYTLTKAGKELYQILDNNENDGAIFDIAEDIYSKYKNKVKITFHKVNWFNSKTIDYEDAILQSLDDESNATTVTH